MTITDFLTLSTQWKDFFWIIFTLVATATSVLTYARVRKSMKQSLYNKITEIQINEYAELLELLSISANNFLISCDVDNVIKFNILGHLTVLECLDEQEMCCRIREAYQRALHGIELPDAEFGRMLEEFESIQICPDAELEQKLKKTNQELIPAEDGRKLHASSEDEPPEKYQLLNIRGVFLNTEKSGNIAGQLDKYANSIYLPKRILKLIQRFHKAYLDFVLGTLTTIVHREEERILAAKEGNMVELDFAGLYNEAMGKTGELVRQYDILKREIRKVLKIDARW